MAFSGDMAPTPLDRLVLKEAELECSGARTKEVESSDHDSPSDRYRVCDGSWVRIELRRTP